MQIEKLEYNYVNHSDDLLSRLRGTIFHVTTQEKFKQIQRDDSIRNNKDSVLRKASITDSFGSARGWVCLFDLRDKDDDTIEFTLRNYNFLSPPGVKKIYTSDYSEYELSIAYLFLNQGNSSNIIPNDFAWQTYHQSGHCQRFVPRTECWYPGDIPLTCIDNALLVTVRASENPLCRALLNAQG